MLLRTPPSGPIRLLSCLIRDTTAKYCGKSFVMIRQMRFLSSSSGVSNSGGGEKKGICVSDNKVGGLLVFSSGILVIKLWWILLLHHQRLTLVYAVEYPVEFLFVMFTVMLLPAFSSLTPQNHQLPLFPSKGSKVGDLHNDRTGGIRPVSVSKYSISWMITICVQVSLGMVVFYS